MSLRADQIHDAVCVPYLNQPFHDGVYTGEWPCHDILARLPVLAAPAALDVERLARALKATNYGLPLRVRDGDSLQGRAKRIAAAYAAASREGEVTE